MAFEKMGNFTFNHADQADELNLAADTAKQKFDSRANELKTAINKVVDLLNATTDGASGADNVGAAAISGVTGTTVQSQMESMKGLVDGKAASNHNHDSSYAPIDLAGTGRTIETVKGNADAIAAHLADTVSELLLVTRDISIVGTQTITTQKKAKSIRLLAALQDGGIIRSLGFWSENNVQFCVSLYGTNNTSIAADVVRVGANSENRARGLISNVTDTKFDIVWSKEGNLTGTASVLLQIEYHGGV